MRSRPSSSFLRALALGGALLLATEAAPAQGVIHVPGDWPTIQAAIDVSVFGDRIEVAPGTYHETLVAFGRAVELVGVGGAESTVIDGAGLDASVLRVEGTQSGTLTLEGFTLLNGSGSPSSGGSSGTKLGGLLQVDGGSVEVRDCVLRGGVASSGGGAILLGGELVMRSCLIEGNAAGKGGGVAGAAQLIECTLRDNHVSGRGGGAFRPQILKGCLIEENSAATGGGVWFRTPPKFEPQLSLSDCVVRNNSAEFGGGIAFIDDAVAFGGFVADLGRGHWFEGNTASDSGGGAYVAIEGFQTDFFLAWARAIDCVFVENEAPTGDGLYAYTVLSDEGIFPGTTEVTNCTFVGDSFELTVNTNTGTTRVRNVIMRAPPVAPLIDVSGGNIDLSHNNIEGLILGTESIDADPLFADLAALDLSLLPGSPCIDTGDPSSPLDPDGTRADMGAVPFHPWRDLGHALEGSTSPRLDGQGSLIAGTPGELLLLDGPASTVAIPVLGLDQIAAPFKGGVMLPSPDIVPGMFPTDAEGALSIPFTWPDGVPSGTEYVLQFWIPEGGGPSGWSASNGLLAVTR